MKDIPKLENEAEERAFWEEADSTEYVDWSKAKPASFPNLKPSLKTISLRLPEDVIERYKTLANKSDVPYQSLMKLALAKDIDEKTKQPKRSATKLTR